MGGENCDLRALAVGAVGSSPRGRGKLRVVRTRQVVDRLIPAWAGKTPHTGSRESHPAAHPRVGGENRKCLIGMVSKVGSSPRGRGKRRGACLRRVQRRLIPAWAGKTPSTGRRATTIGAHPRVGGENGVAGAVLVASGGSSPRGRGKLTFPISCRGGGGLIPAWAGKTRRSSAARSAM